MSETAEQQQPAKQTRKARLLPWIVLTAIVLSYLACVIRLHPANFFGLSEDDSLYFSSAKAIADGQGYILPSIPGAPSATKYPILYPWLLSWVWRWDPSFPANLTLAIALNLAFGAAYLGVAFVFLRSLPGFNDASALVVTALCALNPRLLSISENILSDIPFAVLALAACVVARKATERVSGLAATIACGTLSGLSILMRTMGIPFAAGLYVAIGLRGGWRKSSAFAACIAPFVAAVFWRTLFTAPKMPAMASVCSGSWRMTWLYYTSYAGFWRADVLGHGVFWQTLRNDIISALLQPARYFLNATHLRVPVLALVLVVSLSAIAFRGYARLAKSDERPPIYFALGFYLVPILVWDYAAMDRFLLPFLPLIIAGVWTEVQLVVHQARDASRDKGRLERASAAGFFFLVGVALALGIGVSWTGEIRSVARTSRSRASLLEEKRQAYNWLKQNSPQDARVIAYEDVSVYLYSGRQALRPVIFSAAGAQRPDVLDSDLACITSSGAPSGAKFWLVSDDDFGYEWEPVNSRAKQKEKEMERGLNAVFRSRQGSVRIYQLDSDGYPVI